MAEKREMPLGKTTNYPDEYTPSLLYPIARADSRRFLQHQVFEGYDLWRLYEISFLNTDRMPVVLSGTLKIPCSSAFTVESKSLKLYLNSFAQTVFESVKQVTSVIEHDLNRLLHCKVTLELFEPELQLMAIETFTGICMEKDESTAGLKITDTDINSALLVFDEKSEKQNPVCEKLYTKLFRSLCPVTGQPDFASVSIEYEGKKICRRGLLAYLVSYRKHQGFHENCAERIFSDIKSILQPEKLTVTACFTRRGGIDISPVRADRRDFLMPVRTPRQ